MHVSASTQANLATFLPLAVIGLLLFGIVKWGGGKPWQIIAAVLSGVLLTGTMLGPPIQSILAPISQYLH